MTTLEAHRRRYGHGWTPERVARLKELWSEGQSASQIAGDLGGVSRNAVIGKVHRLGLAGREKPSAPRRVAKPTKAAGSPSNPHVHQLQARVNTAFEQAVARAAAGCADAVAVGLEGVRIEELGACSCRWPVFNLPASMSPADRGAEQRFCGAPTRPGQSYCAEHRARAWRPYVRVPDHERVVAEIRRRDQYRRRAS